MRSSSLIGDIDTSEKLITGVNDTNNVCFAGVIGTGEEQK
jgi:hypothetical protein